ncbi:MAG TPA: hypothetical protein VIM16_20545 [Mucilaginibacter sp.]
MNKKQNILTAVTLSCIILLCILIKCLTLYRIAFDIDTLDRQLGPIKRHITFDSTIGFDTNTDDDNSYQIYIAVKYIMTPQVFLYKKNLDTLILIQSKQKMIRDFPNYRVIAKSENQESIITLITKIK